MLTLSFKIINFIMTKLSCCHDIKKFLCYHDNVVTVTRHYYVIMKYHDIVMVRYFLEMILTPVILDLTPCLGPLPQ
jgi:hypothetical protein